MPKPQFKTIVIYGEKWLKVQLLAFYIDTLTITEKVIAVNEPKAARNHLEESRPEVFISTAAPAYLKKHDLWPPASASSGATRLILIGHDDNQISPFEAINAGAHGLIDNQAPIGMIAQAIITTSQNRFLFCGSPHAIADKQPEAPDLSPREREVLTLIARGQRTKEIAAALHLSPRTVEKYREILSRKTGHADTANLTLFALDAGLLAE